jgi:TATA-box binding protein (TBP) (component of TFIID and TFIIIB)
VFCTNKVVCRLANKRFVVDDFKTEQMIATGQKTPNDVSAAIAERKITIVKNSSATRSAPDISLLHNLRHTMPSLRELTSAVEQIGVLGRKSATEE